MISRVTGYVRRNLIAFLALFIALGGTSYAAVSLPRNSVGTPQLRNGAVTSSKLAGGLGAQVWSVVETNGDGGGGFSYPKGIRTKDWQQTSSSVQGIVVFPHKIPPHCVALATDGGPQALASDATPSASAEVLTGTSEVQVYADGLNGITLAIVCPRGA